MQNEEVLKLKDVAVLLKVGEKTVCSMARKGDFLLSRFGDNGDSLEKTLTRG